MRILQYLFAGTGSLDALQMSVRALLAFFFVLLLIRISGRRSFGQKSPFDYVVAILLGATVSRAIVGASPFLPTLAAALVLVLLHRGLAWICIRFTAVDRVMSGRERLLYHDGRADPEELRKALLAERDLLEALRQQRGKDSLEGVREARLERNGRISIVDK